MLGGPNTHAVVSFTAGIFVSGQPAKKGAFSPPVGRKNAPVMAGKTIPALDGSYAYTNNQRSTAFAVLRLFIEEVCYAFFLRLIVISSKPPIPRQASAIQSSRWLSSPVAGTYVLVIINVLPSRSTVDT